MKFCTKCGSRFEADLNFCTRCGTRIQSAVPEPAPQPAAAPGPPPATEWQTLPTGLAEQRAPSTKSGWLPTVLILLSVLALGIGGLVYASYKMKQKATSMLYKTEATSSAPAAKTPGTERPTGIGDGKPGSPAADPHDDASKLLGNLTSMLGAGDDDGDLVQSVSDKDPVLPCTASPYPDQISARIPLREDTVITTAWGIKYGDVESRILLGAGTPVSITMTDTTAAHKTDEGRDENESSYTDIICNADLASGGSYITTVGLHLPHLIHGVSRLRLSDKSFNEVRLSGKTNFVYLDFMNFGDANKPWHDSSLLTRVEPQDVPYPMIVNDERVTLPAIHLAGIDDSVGKDPRPNKYRSHHAAADIYVIDDPLDPLVLLWKLKDPAYSDGKFRIEVVKIDFKTPHPVNLVEKQLTEQKRAVTYGIYFDFNKDTIRPASEPVLKQIVQAMTDNPAWKLTVEGHTDNIGGDSYNLDLSKRRAAAVKQALVTRYHIASERLSTDGFGASRPVETNDTLEGRARNRRVELTRE